MGNLHPQTPAASNEKVWDRLWLLVGLRTTWAASPSPERGVHELTQPVLDLTPDSHIQPEGTRGSAGHGLWSEGNQGHPSFEVYQPWGSLSSMSEM